MGKKGKTIFLLVICSLIWLGVVLSLGQLAQDFGALVLGQREGLVSLFVFVFSSGFFCGLLILNSILIKQPVLLVISSWPVFLLTNLMGMLAIPVIIIFVFLFYSWSKQALRIQSEVLNPANSRYYQDLMSAVYGLLCILFGVLVFLEAQGYVQREGVVLPEKWKTNLLAPISQQITTQLQSQLQSRDLPIPDVGLGDFLKGEVNETLLEEGSTRQALLPTSFQVPGIDLASELENRLQDVIGPFLPVLLALTGFLAFFSLRFFGVLVVGLGRGTLVGTLWLLEKAQFISIKTETREVKVPEL